MASTNGARKTPATSSPSATKGSLINSSIYDKFLTTDDKKPIKIRLRAPLPKQTAPGNWLDNKIEGATEKKKDGTATPASPLVNPIDPQIAAAFPSGKPFEDTPEIVQCKHCKKPVLKLAATAHVKDCLKKKQEKAQKKKEAKEAKDAALRKERNGGVSPDPSVDEEAGKRGNVSARKTALDGDGGGKKVPGKKRKADDDDDDIKGPSAKKKKKEEVKPKGGKPKGPVDVEKQCGVVLANGQQCARSLTCKSHSMGAKRAVPGRSLPYDVLLSQYQKKNQAKLQRAAIDANAPLADDFEAPGTVDSDEERDQIVAAINRSFRINPLTGQRLGGRPIVTSQIVSTRQKYKHVRVKELLQHSLGGARGAGLFSTPATVSASLPTGGGWLSGGGGLDNVGHGMEAFDGNRRASLSHRGSVHGIPGSRKPSISGQV